MIRLALAITAGFLAGVTGTRIAAMLRQDARRLRRWDGILARLALLMQEQAFSLPEVFRQAAGVSASPDDWLLSVATTMEGDPLLLPADHPMPAWPEEAILRRMLQGMSSGTLETRLQAVEAARAEIALLAGQAQASADKDGKMWAQLGWIGGACLVILLL